MIGVEVLRDAILNARQSEADLLGQCGLSPRKIDVREAAVTAEKRPNLSGLLKFLTL